MCPSVTIVDHSDMTSESLSFFFFFFFLIKEGRKRSRSLRLMAAIDSTLRQSEASLVVALTEYDAVECSQI